LWPLLVSITAHKSVDAIRHENRKKRGGTGSVDSDPEMQTSAKRVDGNSAVDFLDRGPTPEFAVELSELLDWLLNELDATGDLQMREVALLKLDGASTSEIAKSLGCARRTVERKMKIIRHLLADRVQKQSDTETAK
jgi:DNA-directed RNA polymerase specialized sigma24 family protein